MTPFVIRDESDTIISNDRRFVQFEDGRNQVRWGPIEAATRFTSVADLISVLVSWGADRKSHLFLSNPYVFVDAPPEPCQPSKEVRFGA